MFANGTALSGAINGDSYVYTYKVNSTAKITFSYEVTNLFKYTVVRKDYYTREMMNEGDNPPIGIVLCADKSDAVVKYTLPEDNNQIFASKYKLYMPTEEEFKKELKLDDYKRLDRE